MKIKKIFPINYFLQEQQRRARLESKDSEKNAENSQENIHGRAHFW